MLLTAKTILYVTANDGTSEMSLLTFSNAIKGGLKLDEVEITTDPDLKAWLETSFAKRNINPMPQQNLRQAGIIPSAISVPNPMGTAQLRLLSSPLSSPLGRPLSNPTRRHSPDSMSRCRCPSRRSRRSCATRTAICRRRSSWVATAWWMGTLFTM